MIRINLLPIGRRPVEEKIRKEITVFFLLIFFSVSVMVYFHIDHTRTIKQITAEKKTVDKEIRRYQDRQRQLKELQEKHKILEQKLGVIEQLRKNRDLQVRVLDQLAIIVPTDQLWIKTLTQKGNTLTLTGVARGNEVIAQFMEALAKSPYIDANGVVLKQSRQVKIQGYKLKNFNLSAKVIIPAPAKEAPPKKGGKQKAKSSSGGAA
ncbi:MAG: PilN domain-containing protein [Proteobacteria bacterium]|jgi:Tfp pilus assembly protein PilN|nr:PilN domain-containing protein [Pseudomonadota bacterium]MBW2580201.1 PilN domain-containing protein [Deltaproteobacteria bacterium]MBW2720960.1 PilN domain-containing protein [Deltaproteobacteria bacterium]